jgi:hypothetical protein
MRPIALRFAIAVLASAAGCGGGGGGAGGDAVADGVRVAVLLSTRSDPLGLAAAEDVVAKLEATGRFAEVAWLDAGYLGVDGDDLSRFDAVLVASYYALHDGERLGDDLADYVDRGGGVVLALYSFEPDAVGVQGRFADAGYCALLPGSSYVAGDGPLALGAVHDPGHPILAGVARFTGGARSARPATLAVAQGAHRVADWSDGSPLVATRLVGGVRRADLGFFPPSADANPGAWWDPATDGARLMANALLWVAGAD